MQKGQNSCWRNLSIALYHGEFCLQLEADVNEWKFLIFHGSPDCTYLWRKLYAQHIPGRCSCWVVRSHGLLCDLGALDWGTNFWKVWLRWLLSTCIRTSQIFRLKVCQLSLQETKLFAAFFDHKNMVYNMLPDQRWNVLLICVCIHTQEISERAIVVIFIHCAF